MIVTNSFLSQGLDTLVTFNPICIYAETRLDDLLERFYSTGVHQWPVIDAQRHVIGIVSDDDIIRANQHNACEGEAPTAAEFMKTPALTLDSTRTPREALESLLDHHFQWLPITCEDKLWGLVNTSDYIRELAYSSHPARNTPIEKIFDPIPLLIDCHESVERASQRLAVARAEYAVVMEGECPLGVLSARDLRRHKCRAIARTLFEGGPPAAARAVDLLKTTCTVSSRIDVATAALMMFEHQAHGLVVSNRPSDLEGLVTQEQILRHLCATEAAHSG